MLATESVNTKSAMEASQYHDYLNDRRRLLEKELQSLVEQLILLTDKKDVDQQRYDLCLAIKHASEALTRVINEEHLMHCDDLTCKRCGAFLDESRPEFSPMTRYCAHCAN